jgi:hypothetical protein
LASFSGTTKIHRYIRKYYPEIQQIKTIRTKEYREHFSQSIK